MVRDAIERHIDPGRLNMLRMIEEQERNGIRALFRDQFLRNVVFTSQRRAPAFDEEQTGHDRRRSRWKHTPRTAR